MSVNILYLSYSSSSAKGLYIVSQSVPANSCSSSSSDLTGPEPCTELGATEAGWSWFLDPNSQFGLFKSTSLNIVLQSLVEVLLQTTNPQS